MINLKKACACLLTVAASVGVNFSLNSMAMDNELKDNLHVILGFYFEMNNIWERENTKNMSMREMIRLCRDKHQEDKLYALPLADNPTYCVVITEDLTRCIYFDVKQKIVCLSATPKGYGDRSNLSEKEIECIRSCYKTVDSTVDCRYIFANVFDRDKLNKDEFNKPDPLFDDATPDMINLAKQKGIAGYKMDNNQESCQIF